MEKRYIKHKCPRDVQTQMKISNKYIYSYLQEIKKGVHEAVRAFPGFGIAYIVILDF